MKKIVIDENEMFEYIMERCKEVDVQIFLSYVIYIIDFEMEFLRMKGVVKRWPW